VQDPKLQFKPAELSDMALLLTLIQEYYAYDRHPYRGDRLPTTIETLLAHPEWGRIWLICWPDPIGYVVLTFGYSLEALGQEACVDELYLRESYRCKGLGQQTFAFLEQVCQQQGIQRMYLEVERHNLPAQQLYRKIGFEGGDRHLFTRWVGASEKVWTPSNPVE